MFDLDRWQQIYSVLKENKVRTFLTAFGVFWGIFMLVIMLGSGNGMKNGITEGIGDFATNSFFIWAQETTVPYAGYPKGRNIVYNNSDVKDLQQSVAGIDLIAPKQQMGTWNQTEDNVVRGLKSGSYTINGDYPAFNKIDPAVMIHGRFINKRDIEERRKVAVIGRKVHEDLFEPNEDPVGSYIRISGIYYQVVGVYRPLNPNISFGGDKEQSIVVPFSTFQQAYNHGDRFWFMAVTVEEGIPASKVEQQTIDLLKKNHSVAPEDDRAIGHINLEEQFNKIMGLFTGIGVLIWIVGIGTLLAGIIGVSNIMLVVVRERTTEIGIQRAIGATPWNIINQVISEAVVLTVIAGYFGLVAGVGVLEAINQILANSGGEETILKNPGIDFTIAMAALGVLTFFGVIAGVLPAKRAVNIKPIEAIRNF
jgi:putative ABC transport system permease protein